MCNTIKYISILLLFLASAHSVEDNEEHEKSPFYNSAYYRLHDKGFAHRKRDAEKSMPLLGQVDNTNQTKDETAKSSDQAKLQARDDIKDNSTSKNTPVGYSEGENNVKDAPVPSNQAEQKKPVPKVLLNATVPENLEVKVDNKNHTLNSTTPEKLPVTNTGVVKRGLIVFGAFGLMAVVYFIFYRRKSKNYESNNTHNNSDTNQFRYGVLQSDDRRDNLELSRIPLTMESDEEEEDDLEIFDLEQKKKSLSYVNLQTNDEDIVLQSSSKDESKNNLLLDIEDASSDTLINWSSNGSKSIL